MKVGYSIPAYPTNMKNIIKEKSKIESKELGSDFTKILEDTFKETNSLQKDADSKTTDFLSGKTDNIHEVMIASQKAEVSLSFMIEVRNRILEAYQEFSRMQV